ncbi:MAG: hypothetical protein R3252_11020 [Robiginitalea sp.]|nr:hypothetical protein [Robiginitalea sp.]
MTPRSLLLLLFLTLSFTRGTSQSYIDVVSASYGYSPNADFEGNQGQTDLQHADFGLLLPFPIKNGPVLITGLNYFMNRLRVAPTSPESISFYSLAPRVGLQFNYGNRWTGTHVIIPRISTAINNSRDGFQWATLQLFEQQKPSGSSLSLGLYLSEESYGWMLVPIFGGTLGGPDEAWEIRLFLPARGDINFRLSDRLRGGLVFDGLGSTHDFENAEFGKAYVQRIANDLQAYLQFNFGKSLTMAVRGGYSFFRSYRVYQAGDTAGISLANFFFKDNRTPLNSSVTDGFICSVRLVYRLYLEE